MHQHVESQKKTRESLLAHLLSYPKSEITDIFKFIFQSAFGCEHLVSAEEKAIAYITHEYAEMTVESPIAVDPLDGDYSRVHLSCLSRGLTPETLGKLFCRSAKAEENGNVALQEKIKAATNLIAEGMLPFSADDFRNALDQWNAAGFPPVHHSEAFRQAYHPAYRVIANDYVEFLPLFEELDRRLKNGNVVLAIEGGSASGKTTLANLLSGIYDATVFHMDDFFLRPEQRTPERFAEAGGNVDRERFLSEVLLPLHEGKNVLYRPFNCTTQTIESAEKISPKQLTIIEGAYSMHPELSSFYDLTVFLDISPEYQRERILMRNSPQFAERFFNEWIPLEEIYQEKMHVKERCDLSFSICKK